MILPCPVKNARSALFPSGGAMPFLRILSNADGKIQSVVQAGASTTSMRASGSTACTAVLTSSEMTSVAGHPEYVGVRVTTTCSCSIRTPRTMPISSIVKYGSSGSHTVLTCAQVRVMRSSLVTSSPRDKFAEEPASPPTCSSGVPYAVLACLLCASKDCRAKSTLLS